MKATFDLPDALYREVKTRSVKEGRTVREVVVTLFQQWLEKEKTPGASTPSVHWKSYRAPLSQRVAEEPADHSMDSVRKSIGEHWDEQR